MPDMPGDTFISKGIQYVLQPGPKGNLRPYTVGPLDYGDLLKDEAGPLTIQGEAPVADLVVVLAHNDLPKLGWVGLAISAVVLGGAAIWYACKNKEQAAHGK
jgi:hypothetical protein